jgi:hypothetical protein
MIYRNSKGKFISKEEWLSLQPKENKKTMNNSRRKKPTQTAELNTPQEQVISKVDIKEGTQVVEVNAEFDAASFINFKQAVEKLDSYEEKHVDFDKEYKRKVTEFEEKFTEKLVPQDKVIQEKLKEPIKTPGFFTTWFKKWGF